MEMLVVIAIIAVLLGLSAAGMKSMTEGNSTREAIGILKSSFQEAQKMAKGRGLPVRVVIHADDSQALNREDLERYLRFVALAMRDASGDWVVMSKGISLPKGAYLDVDKSLHDKDGNDYAEHLDDNGVFLETGLVDVKLDASTTRKCFFYEFNGLGLLSNPLHEDRSLTEPGEAWFNDVKQGMNHSGWETTAPRLIISEGKLRRVSPTQVVFKAKDETTGARTYRGFYIFRSGVTPSIEDLNTIKTP